MAAKAFSQVFAGLEIPELSASAMAAGPQAVEVALARESLDLADLAALISPAAERDYLEPMAAAAHELTVRRFGRTIHMFAPLYVSNECVSSCAYCGFAKQNDITRTTLKPADALDEARYLTARGFRHLLLVAGEHARIVSPDYLVSVISALAPEVPQLSLEVQTWEVDNYARFVDAGCDGVVTYQETYDPVIYAEVHLRGRKRNYASRLDALDRAGAGGARRLGAGVLLGLAPDWRADVLALAAHARWLITRQWRSEVSVSLPRLRACIGGLDRPATMTDREYTQAICALRLFLPDAAITLSTRESVALRGGLMKVGITHMSAGSKTEPGGYVNSALGADPQFEIEDRRGAPEVALAIKHAGYEPVWKDWVRV